MKKSFVWFVSRIALVIFSYILIYFSVNGLTSNYREGDSINYHIPIAQSYVAKTIINPQYFQGERFLKYSPGANEGILASLIIFKIPMNVFNVFGLIALLGACFYAGKRFLLDNDLSILFAGSIVTLHTMIRWINTQIIDVWMGVWFVLVLALLHKPEKSLRYFLFLGLSCGMLIGSKYTGPIFLAILIIFYFKKLWKYLNIQHLTIFLIPFCLLGLIWYLRNYLVTGNPMYPQGFLFFKDAGFKILSINVWKATFLYPSGIQNFANAIISEFGLWSIALFSPLLLLSKRVRKSKNLNILLIGTACFIVFLFLPSDKHYNIAVSVFRYSYPAFISYILFIFIIAKEWGKEDFVAAFALSNFIIIPELTYRPKLLFALLPVIFALFFPEKVRAIFRNIIPSKGKKRT